MGPPTQNVAKVNLRSSRPAIIMILMTSCATASRQLVTSLAWRRHLLQQQQQAMTHTERVNNPTPIPCTREDIGRHPPAPSSEHTHDESSAMERGQGASHYTEFLKCNLLQRSVQYLFHKLWAIVLINLFSTEHGWLRGVGHGTRDTRGSELGRGWGSRRSV